MLVAWHAPAGTSSVQLGTAPGSWRMAQGGAAGGGSGVTSVSAAVPATSAGPVPPFPAHVLHTVFCSNLPDQADRLYLYECFAPFGAILSVKVREVRVVMHLIRCSLGGGWLQLHHSSQSLQSSKVGSTLASMLSWSACAHVVRDTQGREGLQWCQHVVFLIRNTMIMMSVPSAPLAAHMYTAAEGQEGQQPSSRVHQLRRCRRRIAGGRCHEQSACGGQQAPARVPAQPVLAIWSWADQLMMIGRSSWDWDVLDLLGAQTHGWDARQTWVAIADSLYRMYPGGRRILLGTWILVGLSRSCRCAGGPWPLKRLNGARNPP